jgi:hypothetical protein
MAILREWLVAWKTWGMSETCQTMEKQNTHTHTHTRAHRGCVRCRTLKHISLLQRHCYMYDYGHSCQATGPKEVTSLFIHVAQFLLLHTLLHVFYDECNHFHFHCYNFDLRFGWFLLVWSATSYSILYLRGRDPVVQFVIWNLLTLLNSANPNVLGNAISSLQNVVYVALLFDFCPLQ